MQLGDNLPKLTHILCFAFGRATTGVSYVVPAYIADRLCEQGRAYLRYWAEDPKVKPVFEAPNDADGKASGRVAFDRWKKARALQLARTPSVWGGQYNDSTALPEKERRYNPWHPNFNKVMFWM